MMSADEIKKFKQQIKDTHANTFAEIAQVSRDMAQKYKNFSSYPRLDKAVKIEDKIGIPARAWVDIRQMVKGS
jgi:predicted transcriptional regulator